LLDEAAQRSTRSDEVFLPDDFVECRRTQPRGQGRLLAEPIRSDGAEQIVAHSELRTKA
jgi:hypothetical protein